MKQPISTLKALLVLTCLSLTATPALADAWENWRGASQRAVSADGPTNVDWSRQQKAASWSVPLQGRGAPVVHDGRVYSFGYTGEGAELREVLAAFDADSGQELWRHEFADFISDIIYDRYAIGSPTVDPTTGHVYLMTSPGLMVAMTRNGELLWQLSMMESFGRLTFPNGRTGAPLIADDLVVVRGITANWGRQGPARDRFYAFDKLTGTPVWASTPGVRPQDSSYSTPVLGWLDGKRVFYAGTGCGNVVCVDVRTGEPVWRYQMAHGGVNSTVSLVGDTLIAIHGKENLDTSRAGRMIALNVKAARNSPPGGGTPVLDPSAELWRNDLCSFTSSAAVTEQRAYQTVQVGELHAVDLASGESAWTLKLGPDQLHASPVLAGGLLYVPMHDGTLHVVDPKPTPGELIASVKLEGSCLGGLAVADGRLYVHTTERLYAFGKGNEAAAGEAPESQPTSESAPAAATRLQLVPNEVLMAAGDKVEFQARLLDAVGRRVGIAPIESLESWIPPTAKVRARMDAQVNSTMGLTVTKEAQPSAGAFQATAGGLKGTIRGRVLPAGPFTQDFEGFSLSEEPADNTGQPFAYPPLSWIGGRFKWKVEQLGASKVLVKTLDRMLFQRSTTFIGHPRMRSYTLQADVRSDGDRRTLSTVGLVNQRYLIALKGNWQQLEVSSNQERLKVATPFRWKAGVWYTLKTRVDVEESGAATVRAKVWPREDKEPTAWTLEVPHRSGHPQGAPGLFGFSPQNRFAVYIDNVSITEEP